MKIFLRSLTIACITALILVGCNSDKDIAGNNSNSTSINQTEQDVSSVDSFEVIVIEKGDETITVTSNENTENKERVYKMLTNRIFSKNVDNQTMWESNPIKEVYRN